MNQWLLNLQWCLYAWMQGFWWGVLLFNFLISFLLLWLLSSIPGKEALKWRWFSGGWLFSTYLVYGQFLLSKGLL